MSRKIDPSQAPAVADAGSAEAFLRWCCRAIGLAFHPDTGFRDYIEVDGTRTFTEEEASLLDDQMAAAFKFVVDPYAVCLDEFQAMQAGPASPAARTDPAKDKTTQLKVLLARRTDIADPILSGFTAARIQLHVREARVVAGLTVVHFPTEDDQHLDRFAISGGLDHIICWIGKLARLGVAEFRYEVELPPAAREEGDKDEWASRLADWLDEPGVSFTCTICAGEAKWRLGLPAPTAD